MKSLALVAVCLVVGIGLGLAATRQEFSGEQLPTETYRSVTPVKSAAPSQERKLVIVGGSAFNFGEMDRHATGEHTFLFRNDGLTPIGLKQGQTTCKCTMSEMKDGELNPGQSMPIKLSWTAKTGEQDFSQSAEILTSNYPQQPVVRLHVYGKIIDALRADRASLSLGSLSASENAIGRFKVYAFRGEEPLAIVKHEFTLADKAAFFEAEFRPLTADELKAEKGVKSGVEVTIRLKSGLPLGTTSQTIRLTTNLSETSPLDVAIEARIVGDIMLVGPNTVSEKNMIALGSTRSSQGKTGKYHVLVKGPHRSETTLKIASITPTDGFQAVLGEPLTDNPLVTRYPLTITIPVGARPVSNSGPTEDSAGVLRIETTHPQIKEFVVLVRYTVTE